jgi:hypothetical protein
MRYVGIDLHKHYSHFAVLNQNGQGQGLDGAGGSDEVFR